MTRSLLLTLCALVTGTVGAAQPVKITGVYSNLHYVAEGGDLLGTEVFIVLGGQSGYFAVLQCAEGGPSKPVIVSVTVHGTKVEFAPHEDLASHCPMAKFNGIISSAGLRGKFEGTEIPGFLKRKRSYWQ